MINKNVFPLYLIGFYPIALILGTLISELITAILSILYIVECVKKKKIIFIKDPLIYFLILIWIYLLINLFFISIDSQLSFNRSVFFIRHVFLILTISYFLTKYYEYTQIVFKLWMVSILITIIDLYVQFFFGQNILGFKSPWEARLSGFFNEELKVAHLLIGFFLPCFAYFIQKNNKNIFLYVCLLLYFLILILTNERANIIRGTLAIIIFFVFLPYLKTRFKIILCSSLLLFFCSVIFFVKPVKVRFINEISIMSKKMNTDKSLKNYILMSNYGPHYFSSVEIFKNNKFFGTGIKTFRISCKKISIEKYYLNNNFLSPKEVNQLTKKGCSTHPHQYYFEILSGLGLIGFAIFISFFVYLLLRILNNFISSKNLVLLSTGSFFFLQLIPLLPTGSFFTSFGSTIFFINLGLIFTYLKKHE